MGKNRLGWICTFCFFLNAYNVFKLMIRFFIYPVPIGRGMSDGTSYPVNPRFDDQGRMRRRSEWPENLR